MILLVFYKKYHIIGIEFKHSLLSIKDDSLSLYYILCMHRHIIYIYIYMLKQAFFCREVVLICAT